MLVPGGRPAEPTPSAPKFSQAPYRPSAQRATLVGLGLNKMHNRRTLVDSPQVRGMVAKVSHLVRIVDDEPKA